MDHFYDLFMNFLKHQNVGYLDFQWMDRNFSGFFKNILICASKINFLMCLERHECD